MRLVRIATDVNAAVWAQCLADVPPEEHAHAAHANPVQRRRVVAHAVLRRLLGARLSVAPRRVRLQRQRWGKPVLTDAATSGVHFSLSYSGNDAVLALASTPVGIDLESTVPDDWDAVARHVYAPEETARLHASADPRQSFLHLWTAKEAVLKLWGTGFQFEPRAFCVPPASPDFQPVHVADPTPHTPACVVAHAPSAPGLTVALALYAPPASITWEYDAHA